MELHVAKHERDGEVDAWRERQARERERAALDEAYKASLRADQEAEAEEAARQEAEEAARQEAEEAARQEAEAIARREAAAAAARKADEEAQRALKRRREELAGEPDVASSATTLKVRLPSGRALIRRLWSRRTAP